MDAPEPDIHSNFPIAKKERNCFIPMPWVRPFNISTVIPCSTPRGIYEGQRSTNDNKECSFSPVPVLQGIAALWLRRVERWYWQHLGRYENQIAAGINFSMSGVPYWTFDAGGFAVERRYEKGYPKTNGRVAGTLVPVWKFPAIIPGTRAISYREPYNIAGENEPEFAAAKSAIEMRYKLLPHLYSLAAAVHFKMVRCCVDWWWISRQIKNTSAIIRSSCAVLPWLVSPVYTFGQRSRNCICRRR